MSRFVQFVVCKHTGDSKKYLFYAPAFSDIKEGDSVLVETEFGKRRATVLAFCTICDNDTDVERALRALAGVEDKPLKRVIGKYQFTKFNYSEDENND